MEIVIGSYNRLRRRMRRRCWSYANNYGCCSRSSGRGERNGSLFRNSGFSRSRLGSSRLFCSCRLSGTARHSRLSDSSSGRPCSFSFSCLSGSGLLCPGRSSSSHSSFGGSCGLGRCRLNVSSCLSREGRNSSVTFGCGSSFNRSRLLSSSRCRALCSSHIATTVGMAGVSRVFTVRRIFLELFGSDSEQVPKAGGLAFLGVRIYRESAVADEQEKADGHDVERDLDDAAPARTFHDTPPGRPGLAVNVGRF